MSEKLGFITREDVVVVLTHRIIVNKRNRYSHEAFVDMVEMELAYTPVENRRYYIRFNDGYGCWVFRSDIELQSRLNKRLADRVILLHRINYALDTKNEELFNELTKELNEAYYEAN